MKTDAPISSATRKYIFFNFIEIFSNSFVTSQELTYLLLTFQCMYSYSFNRTRLERAVENFNIQHGSQNQVITNAIFTNGYLDPLLDHGIVEYDVAGSEVVSTSCKFKASTKLVAFPL